MVFEEFQIYRAIDQSDKLIVGVVQPARNDDVPGSRSAILKRCAYEYLECRIGSERLKIVPVGNIDPRDRPDPRGADDIAVKINQPDEVNLRKTDDLFIQKLMGFGGAHSELELILADDAFGRDML